MGATDTVIGHNVHELLWRRRMTQAPLIQALGLSRSSLQKKLRGQQSWSAADIVAAAEVLGVEPGDLFRLPPQRMWAPWDSNPQPTDYKRRVRHPALLEVAA